MKTTDELLQFIVNNNFSSPFDEITSKDKKTLISLYRQSTEPTFLTENQSQLLIRILNFYKKNFTQDHISLIDKPNWTRPFRILEHTKNVSISEEKNKIIIEFSYDKDIKKHVLSVLASTKGNYEMHGVGLITVDLNEKNVIIIVDQLKKNNFVFSPKIIEIYNNINSLLEKKQEILDTTVNFNEFFKERVLKDIQDNNLLDVKILDRRIRHQYKHDLQNNSKDLYFQIANRKSTNVHINRSFYTIQDILNHLQILERFPVLIILDSRNVDQCIDFTNQIATYPVVGSKGIYFRLDNNNEKNKEFNQIIKNNLLNVYLDNKTDIAVIGNSILPKFFIKSTWKPKSVISLTNGFRNNKAHVFCNDVDLKIYYNETAPMIGDLHEIV